MFAILIDLCDISGLALLVEKRPFCVKSSKPCDLKIRMNLECEHTARARSAPVRNPNAAHQKRSTESSSETLLMVVTLTDAIARGLRSVIATFVTADDNVFVE